jgi:biotin carboxylase
VANVVFVAPFFAPATVRIISRVAGLEGVRCAVVSQQPADLLPSEVRRLLVDFEQVGDALATGDLCYAVQALGQRLGGVDRVFGALEQAQVPIAEVRAELGIEGLGVAAATNFRDKARMKTVLGDAGLPCARHCLAASPEQASSFVAEVGLPVVVKPPAGAGALATYSIREEAALGQFLAANPPAPGDEVLLEQHVAGDEYTLDTISIDGVPVWHSISRYIPTPLEALEKPWVQLCIVLPRSIDEARFDAARTAGTRALAALGMGTGISHLEWFQRADGSLAISEVAARPPGEQLAQIIGYAHGIDLFSEWARVMIFGTFDPPERCFATGVAFLRGQGQGPVTGFTGFDEVARELGPIIVEHSLPRPGRQHSTHYGGVGYVIVRHPETEVVISALGRIITGTRVLVGR